MVFLCTMCILDCHHIHVLSSPSKIEMAHTFKGKTLFGKLMQCPWHTLPVALPSGPRSAIRSLWPCGECHQGKSGKISYSMFCALSIFVILSTNLAKLCNCLLWDHTTDGLVKHWLQEQMPQDIMAESLVASSVGPEWVYNSKGPALTNLITCRDLVEIQPDCPWNRVCWSPVAFWPIANSLEQLGIWRQNL